MGGEVWAWTVAAEGVRTMATGVEGGHDAAMSAADAALRAVAQSSGEVYRLPRTTVGGEGVDTACTWVGEDSGRLVVVSVLRTVPSAAPAGGVG